jgi:hypothetical protein
MSYWHAVLIGFEFVGVMAGLFGLHEAAGAHIEGTRRPAWCAGIALCFAGLVTA